MRAHCSNLFLETQKRLCSQLAELDPTPFSHDSWSREAGGGGGITKIIQNGAIFEKGGVNFSEVSGELDAEMCKKLTGKPGPENFFATGISLVLHPNSPMIPTVHANLRYIEVGELAWFGGGTDLTPYYLYPEDASTFHLELKNCCDKHSKEYYPRFKKWCDEYFYLPHRGEARGVGGIFYDYLGKEDPQQLSAYYSFSESLSSVLLDGYIEIVKRRKAESYTQAQKDFQLHRRGRYVEFNLIYDRGTLFGLRTGGRVESILMSLPAEVRWGYCYTPAAGSQEAELIKVLKSPRAWI